LSNVRPDPRALSSKRDISDEYKHLIPELHIEKPDPVRAEDITLPERIMPPHCYTVGSATVTQITQAPLHNFTNESALNSLLDDGIDSDYGELFKDMLVA